MNFRREINFYSVIYKTKSLPAVRIVYIRLNLINYVTDFNAISTISYISLMKYLFTSYRYMYN